MAEEKEMRKKTFTGWIGKSVKDLSELVHKDKTYDKIDLLYLTRGKKEDWDFENWPPIKVKVTIEVI